MKTATITQTKNQLSALLDEVKRGETVIILDRGRAVARLTSIAAQGSDGEVAGRLERLELSGLLRRAETEPDPHFADEWEADVGTAQRMVNALLEERREGR